MNRIIILNSLFLIAFRILAVDYQIPELPDATYADTETMTNTSIRIPNGGIFILTMSLPVSVTNSVEAQLGSDDGDGVLSREETELRIGWECGMWFADSPSTPHNITCPALITSGMGILTLTMRIKAGQGVDHIGFYGAEIEEYQDIADLLPSRTSVTNWNMIQLVAREHILGGDNITVRTSNNGSLIILR